MKPTTSKAVVISIGLYLLFLATMFIFDYKALAMAGMFGMLAAVALLVLGGILALFKNSRDVGFGLLIAAVIIGVIGFGVCSIGYTVNNG